MAKRIIVSVISELTTDQRVIRISSTLQNMGFDVTVIARALSDSLPLGNYPFKSKRIKCRFKKGVMAYAEFNFKLFWVLLFAKTDYLLSNDLDTLSPNFLVSKLRNKFLFYDTHEYFTGVPELTSSPFKHKIWRKLEDILLPRLKVIYTVNDSVKKKYESIYPTLHLKIVRNIPPKESVIPVNKPREWQGKIILLIQGIGIHPGRGGMELLLAMPFLPEQYRLVYIGGGLEWDSIELKRKELQLEKRVEMRAKVAPEILKKYTPLADIGFTLDGLQDDNYLFNLPNKLFDYIHAGIPVIATPIPEVKKIVEQYKIGICIENLDPKEIAFAVEKLMGNKSQYDSYKNNTLKASNELCWQNEQKEIIEIYKSYL